MWNQKMLHYLLTKGVHHWHNCWYQLCNNGDISLLGWMRLKIRIASKTFQIKVVRNWILYKKVRTCICLSTPRVELEGSKDWQLQSIILKGNSKLYTFRAQCCQKYASHQKKLHIKVVHYWISSKKSVSAYVYVPPEWS